VVAGIDLRGALARMSGLKPLYLRAATEFIKVLPNIVDEFKKLMDSDRYAATMQMHTIKGNAALLGATELAEAAGKLEKQCKSNPEQPIALNLVAPLEHAVAATQISLAQVIAHLEGQTSARNPIGEHIGAVPASTGTVSTNVARALIERLEDLNGLLTNGDLAALERFADHRNELNDALHDRLAPLEDALNNLELDDALQHSIVLIEFLATAT
jgi:HPt (histidine-containing phosphotransfer) domain-containing protein